MNPFTFPYRYLYADSPFLPQISIQSILEVNAMVAFQGLHPATAISHETRRVATEHGLLVDSELEWLMEKFPIDDEGLRDYIFGMLIPPGLIVATDMIRDYSYEEVFSTLFSGDGDDFDELIAFTADQMRRTEKLAQWEDPDPMKTGIPIYTHCQTDVWSLNPWYSVGVLASQKVFEIFASCFDPTIEIEQ